MKNLFASKLNWLGIAAVATAVGDFVANFKTDAWTWQTIVLFATGVITIVIRTFYTSTAIKNPIA